jgi:hypothetical protein
MMHDATSTNHGWWLVVAVHLAAAQATLVYLTEGKKLKVVGNNAGLFNPIYHRLSPI